MSQRPHMNRCHSRAAALTSRGFSLVELLVALAFVSLLMAGMAKVFASSVSVFTTTNETIGVQRNNRWALEQINDDISQMGMVFPDRVLPLYITGGSTVPFRILPNTAVTGVVRVSDSNPASTEAETGIVADHFQFFSDVALPVTGTWAADTLGQDSTAGAGTAAPTSATVTFTRGSVSDLRSGDIMVILDGGEKGKWEYPMITGSPVANPIVFETSQTALAKFSFNPGAPGIRLAHKAGVPVMFIRPAQMIRYTVQPVALDPSNAAVRVPCLVRQIADYPTSGAIDWTVAPTQVVAENVVGFRVDLSFNGGTNWARTGATSWGDIQTNANAQLSTAGLPGFQTITDPSNTDWFRNINCLIRLDITTRSAVRREEYNATPGAREYRTRTQTLLISPRNFGTGK